MDDEDEVGGALAWAQSFPIAGHYAENIETANYYIDDAGNCAKANLGICVKLRYNMAMAWVVRHLDRIPLISLAQQCSTTATISVNCCCIQRCAGAQWMSGWVVGGVGGCVCAN